MNNSEASSAISHPTFLYGTAWKEDDTERLTRTALEQGFRGIDTANQRKHYHEAGVGAALKEALRTGALQRDELFVQTKFTFRDGQDHRLPYDPAAPIKTQVGQSFASSLEHLGVEALDSYVLHGPTRQAGLGPQDWEAWEAMELVHTTGRTKFLGVSNVNLPQLELLWRGARVKPQFVQNRCYAVMGWDRDVRAFCRTHGIVYQGFSLLTANRPVLAHPAVLDIAARHKRHVTQVIFRFALDVGMLPLTGTTNADHMRDDLAVGEFRLDHTEIVTIESLVER